MNEKYALVFNQFHFSFRFEIYQVHLCLSQETTPQFSKEIVTNERSRDLQIIHDTMNHLWKVSEGGITDSSYNKIIELRVELFLIG